MKYTEELLTVNFPLSDLTIIRAQRPGKVSFKFWVAPAGADAPPLDGNAGSYGLSSVTKPFKMGDTFRDDGFPLSFELCAGFLRANPGFHGNIVVFGKNRQEQKKDGKVWVKTLTEQYKIPRGQLRVFYTGAKHFDSGGGYQPYSDVEFWLVPDRSKKRR